MMKGDGRHVEGTLTGCCLEAPSCVVWHRLYRDLYHLHARSAEVLKADRGRLRSRATHLFLDRTCCMNEFRKQAGWGVSVCRDGARDVTGGGWMEGRMLTMSCTSVEDGCRNGG